MSKKTFNQNTRISEDEREFLDNVASSLGTDRSDVVRRMVSEWQRYGVSGTAESLRTCAVGADRLRQVTLQLPQNPDSIGGDQPA